MAHCTALLIDLTLGEHLQILGERRGGYVQKWHLRYKTSDISETKQSRAKLTIVYAVRPIDCDKCGDLAWPATEVKEGHILIHAAGYSESQHVPLEEICAAQKWLRDLIGRYCSTLTLKCTHLDRGHRFQIPHQRRMGGWKCACPACVRKSWTGSLLRI